MMILDVWDSFWRLPLWVQVWVGLILVPANLLTLLFVRKKYGKWIAVLAIGGMLPNIPITLIERGMSKLMSLPHIIFWTPLCVLILWLLKNNFKPDRQMGRTFVYFLVCLLLINTISLAFDFSDFIKWLAGDRGIA